MSNAIILEIPGDPIGKGRPRVRVIGGKYGHIYTDNKTQAFEKKVALIASTERKMLEGPLRVNAFFYFKRPKSRSKLKEKYITSGRAYDLDNLLKSLLDGLNGILFEDDKQVCAMYAEKLYTDHEPKIIVRVEGLEDE